MGVIFTAAIGALFGGLTGFGASRLERKWTLADRRRDQQLKAVSDTELQVRELIQMAWYEGSGDANGVGRIQAHLDTRPYPANYQELLGPEVDVVMDGIDRLGGKQITDPQDALELRARIDEIVFHRMNAQRRLIERDKPPLEQYQHGVRKASR